MTALKVHLLVIDGQNGFMDDPANTELPVLGAVADMQRIARFVKKNGNRLQEIHATLDCHQEVHIAHPCWHLDQNGNHPQPFTIITAADYRAGIWQARTPALTKYTLQYAESLERSGKFLICVWPPHCRIGTWGNNLQADFDGEIRNWAIKRFATINYVTKGSNPLTEHYGALMAEVPDPSDPSTMLNTQVIQMLQSADVVLVGGEALSHCVRATVTQVAENIGVEHVRKFHIVRDWTSPVPAIPNGPDFPRIAEEWLSDMERLGMTVTTSDRIFN